MRTTRMMIIALALSLPACTLLAQNDAQPPDGPPPGAEAGGPPDGGPGPGPGRRHRPPPIMAALDADRDGVLSAAEITNATVALKTLDKDSDGQITLEEAMGPHRGGPGGPGGPPPPDAAKQSGGGRPRHPVPPIFAALDTNKDGVLSADEIANAPASLLKLDKNGDGKLTMDELRPQGPPPPGRAG